MSDYEKLKAEYKILKEKNNELEKELKKLRVILNEIKDLIVKLGG